MTATKAQIADDFDLLGESAVRDNWFATAGEKTQRAAGAVCGDLAVVNVAGQFGRVLILLILGLEGAASNDSGRLGTTRQPIRCMTSSKSVWASCFGLIFSSCGPQEIAT